MLIEFCRRNGIKVNARSRNKNVQEIANNPELAHEFINLVLDELVETQEQLAVEKNDCSTYAVTLNTILRGRTPSEYDLSKMPDGLRKKVEKWLLTISH